MDSLGLSSLVRSQTLAFLRPHPWKMFQVLHGEVRTQRTALFTPEPPVVGRSCPCKDINRMHGVPPLLPVRSCLKGSSGTRTVRHVSFSFSVSFWFPAESQICLPSNNVTVFKGSSSAVHDGSHMPLFRPLESLALDFSLPAVPVEREVAGPLQNAYELAPSVFAPHHTPHLSKGGSCRTFQVLIFPNLATLVFLPALRPPHSLHCIPPKLIAGTPRLWVVRKDLWFSRMLWIPPFPVKPRLRCSLRLLLCTTVFSHRTVRVLLVPRSGLVLGMLDFASQTVFCPVARHYRLRSISPPPI